MDEARHHTVTCDLCGECHNKVPKKGGASGERFYPIDFTEYMPGTSPE